MQHGHCQFKQRSLPKVQISLGIFTLFEKIYDGEPILTQCRYLETINDLK
jgi:hypothetical protein